MMNFEPEDIASINKTLTDINNKLTALYSNLSESADIDGRIKGQAAKMGLDVSLRDSLSKIISFKRTISKVIATNNSDIEKYNNILSQLDSANEQIDFEGFGALMASGNYSLADLIYKYGFAEAQTGKYDWDLYFRYISGLSQSKNKPSVDLASTDYKTVEEFNRHIAENVNQAGFGSREGVVAAGKSLIVDYAVSTDNKLRYHMTQYVVSEEFMREHNIVPGVGSDRQAPDTEGIVKDDFYLDCSTFSSWALYNGGYKVPTDTYLSINDGGGGAMANANSMLCWSNDNGYTKSVGAGNGQPGDYVDNGRHIVMVADVKDDGYYCLEFSDYDNGGRLSFRNFDDLNNKGYSLIDMTDYYNNPNNVDEERRKQD